VEELKGGEWLLSQLCFCKWCPCSVCGEFDELFPLSTEDTVCLWRMSKMRGAQHGVSSLAGCQVSRWCLAGTDVGLLGVQSLTGVVSLAFFFFTSLDVIRLNSKNPSHGERHDATAFQ